MEGRPVREKTWKILSLLTVALLLAACGGGATSDGEGAAGAADATAGETSEGAAELGDYTSETLNFTVAFSAGGVNDTMSRLIADIIQQKGIWTGDVVVENLEGGSGARGWGEVFAQRGNPLYITTTSGSFLATPLQADTPWGPTDFTPIALLATDEAALWVRADSPHQTLEDFIEAAKQNPPTIAGVGTAQLDFLAPAQVADQAGFEFEYVSHDGTPEAINSLLSGSVDALARVPGPMLGLLEAGDVRALAISGEQELEALEGVPTFASEGYEITVSLPRALVMPPDVEQRYVDFWIDAMQQVVATPEWDAYIEDNLLTENLLYGEEATAYFEEASTSFEEALRSEGVIQ
jgi:putative tricarboxylic transport membrane protein